MRVVAGICDPGPGRALRAVLLALAVVSCGGDGATTTTATSTSATTNTATVLVVSPSSVPGLAVGASTTLSAAVKNALGQDIGNSLVVWSSGNASIASVNSAGTVTARAVGTTTISATVSSLSATVAVTVIGVGTPEALAQLPLVFLNTVAPPAPDVGGVVITVNAGGNFQNALNAAQPGDVIALANGASFTGNFVLPNKGSSSTRWITIRPQSLAGMPVEGARMTPTQAAAINLPRLLSPNNLGAIATAPGAHHFRFIGIEVTVAAGVTPNTGLVRFGEDGGNGQVTLASVPHDLVLDRSYVHGNATAMLRRGVALNSAASAVIDSYISECHEVNGTDAQAIAGWNGPGPFKIVNNYLEASTENIIWGGTDPGVPNLIPSDIEIRHNHFFKPTAWKGVWLVKNLYESKNSQRVLIEGNLFENNWQDGQEGTAISLKSSNVGACPWCATQDITVRYNLFRNIGGAIVVSGSPDNNFPDIHANHLTLTDNVFQNINTGLPFVGVGYGVLVNGDPADVTIAHNTIISPTHSALYFAAGVAPRLTYRDNIVGGGANGIKGSGIGAGVATLVTFTPSGMLSSNVVILGNSAGYPAGNAYPASLAAVGFVNAGTFDFRLLPTSPYKGTASDGKDPGADIDAVTRAIQGVIVP